INTLGKNHPHGKWRIRLTVAKSGTFDLHIDPVRASTNTRVSLAKTPIKKDNPFLYHKTTHRSFYEEHSDTSGNYFDTLLWNEAGEITEFTIGNVVLELDGVKYTPPVTCGL